jgi:hypothetical protein
MTMTEASSQPCSSSKASGEVRAKFKKPADTTKALMLVPKGKPSLAGKFFLGADRQIDQPTPPLEGDLHLLDHTLTPWRILKSLTTPFLFSSED